MKKRTIDSLLQLNKRFYETNASEFDVTRRRPWVGWDIVVKRYMESWVSSVVDLGCGNGRLASYLDRKVQRKLKYIGIDQDEQLIKTANNLRFDTISARFDRGDIMEETLFTKLGKSKFDVGFLFGVMHHIPGVANRKGLIANIHKILNEQGTLVLTIWRFMENRRLLKRVLNEVEGIDIDDLEEGDHFLKWSDSSVPRYCHYPSREEVSSWWKDSEFEKVDEFLSDGRGGELNQYIVLKRL